MLRSDSIHSRVSSGSMSFPLASSGRLMGSNIGAIAYLMATRSFNRPPEGMRPVAIEPGIQKFSLGSVLVSFGDTRVICAANIEEKVPGWMGGRGQGWLTAEYSMLPGSGQQRTQRDV